MHQQDSWKQAGHPITHTVVQPFYKDRGKATQYLVLDDKNSGTTRYFYIQGTKNPGELDHFTIYYVEEKEGIQSGNQRIESA